MLPRRLALRYLGLCRSAYWVAHALQIQPLSFLEATNARLPHGHKEQRQRSADEHDVREDDEPDALIRDVASDLCSRRFPYRQPGTKSSRKRAWRMTMARIMLAAD